MHGFFYFWDMLARKKVNKSGAVSVQVLTKANGASKLVGPIGRSNNAEAVERLVREGCRYITPFGGQKTFDFLGESNIVESAFRSISSHTEVGTELLLGKIFDEVGFDTIQDNTSRQLVSSRLTYPVSELKTRDYLGKYHDLDYPVQQIYRHVDKLHSAQEELVQAIGYEHTKKRAMRLAMYFTM